LRGRRHAGFLGQREYKALKSYRPGFSEDHAHANNRGGLAKQQIFVAEMLPVETNIIIFHCAVPTYRRFNLQKMKEQIYWLAMTADRVRIVTHLDIRPEMVQRTIGND